MKLLDLKPEFWDEGRTLAFLCPKCPHPETDPLHAECWVAIGVDEVHQSGKVWGIVGRDFATLSVTPSVAHHCKSEAHFYITKGEIQML